MANGVDESVDPLNATFYEVKSKEGVFITNITRSEFFPDTNDLADVYSQPPPTESQIIQMALSRLENDPQRTFLSDTVPDAPFKGNAWAELSLKRVIRMAAEGG